MSQTRITGLRQFLLFAELTQGVFGGEGSSSHNIHGDVTYHPELPLGFYLRHLPPEIAKSYHNIQVGHQGHFRLPSPEIPSVLNHRPAPPRPSAYPTLSFSFPLLSLLFPVFSYAQHRLPRGPGGP